MFPFRCFGWLVEKRLLIVAVFFLLKPFPYVTQVTVIETTAYYF